MYDDPITSLPVEQEQRILREDAERWSDEYEEGGE